MPRAVPSTSWSIDPMRLVLVDPPAVEPLDAAEVRTRLGGIPDSLSDDAIAAFIKAGRETLDGPDGFLQRALIAQTWKLLIDGGFPCGPIRIPLPPLISIVAVRFVDQSGDIQTLDESRYQVLEGSRPMLCPIFGAEWPAARQQLNSVEVEFIAGYGDDPEDVPEPIRSAIALQVSHLRSLSAQNLFLSQDTVDGVGSKQYIVGGNAGAAIADQVRSLVSFYKVYV